MLSQGVSAQWAWLIDCLARGVRPVRVVFLLRRSALKTVVSRVANDADKESGRAARPHDAHPTDDARVGALRDARVALPLPKMWEELAVARAAWDALERLRLYADGRGVPTARLVYEDLDADHTLFTNVTDFLLGGLSATDRAACRAAAGAAVDGLPAKIHTRPLRNQIANWAEVAAALANSTYARCLREDAGAAGTVDDVLDPAASLTSRPCWVKPPSKHKTSSHPHLRAPGVI